jgi:UDP-4-amino-4,6-dideoxy-N-acetyl-beta-L-altrosamine transaminase
MKLSYGRQTIEEDDIRAVVAALESRMITQGPLVDEFERALAAYTGARYAVCCSSGTAALHLASLAAGLIGSDSVVTTPNTFIATANSAVYVGATPLFADIDPETHNIDTALVAKLVKATPGVRALVPVHFAGLSSDMEALAEIAREHGLTVIEDACHALGGALRGPDGAWSKVGSCTWSDMTVFSFHAVKSITTGEGGAVTTNDEGLYKRLKLMRNHGMTKEPAPPETGVAADPWPPWYYEMHEPGFNYRLTDIQCALGLSQLAKLDRFIERRAELAALYTKLFTRYPYIQTPVHIDGVRSAHHLYPVEIDFDGLGVDKRFFFESMTAAGIQPQVHYIPVHLQPYYRERFGLKEGDFPNAESFYAREVSLPIYPLLKDAEVAMVVETVVKALEGVVSTDTLKKSSV